MTHATMSDRARAGLLALAAIAALLSALLGGLLVAAPSAQAATSVPTKTLLGQLSVATEHTGGYSRSKFTLWADADRNSCDTREEVLRAEALRRPRLGSSCKVLSGKWLSKYDGRTFTDPSKLDIDHLVALNEAWQSGAWKWTAATRKAYANDLGFANSLIAVSATSNRSKGDREPQNWMPAKSRCWYVASWVTVKWRWHLKVNKTEKAYLTKQLSGCGWPKVSKPSRPAIRTTTTTSTTPTGGTDPRFDTCTAAKAAGYGPYYRGRDVEYAWYQDRDSDGIVCE